MMRRTHIKGDTGRGSCEDRVMDLVEEDGKEPYFEVKNVRWAIIPYDNLIRQLMKNKHTIPY